MLAKKALPVVAGAVELEVAEVAEVLVDVEEIITSTYFTRNLNARF